MSNQPRPDRRVQRTRQLLHDALMALIIEKGYEAISVQDITDRANVARTTFYLHYRDKQELLFDGMTAIYDALIEQHTPIDRGELRETGFSQSMLDPIEYHHVAQHADFYRAMFSEKGSAAFMTHIRAYMATIYRETALQPLVDAQHPPRVPLDLIANALAGAEIGLINWWLDNDMPYTPDEMTRFHYMLSAFGLLWALRLDRPAPE